MKLVKISDSTYDILKELAEKRGISVNQLIDEIINVYMGGAGDRAIAKIFSKIIQLQYATKCRKCGKEINVNELAYYVKYEYVDKSVKSYVLCLDCYFSSGALAKYYIKKKELEAIIRGLRAEADSLVKELQANNQLKEVIEVKASLANTLAMLREILHNTLINTDNTKIDLVYDALTEIKDKLAKIESLTVKSVKSENLEKKKIDLL